MDDIYVIRQSFSNCFEFFQLLDSYEEKTGHKCRIYDSRTMARLLKKKFPENPCPEFYYYEIYLCCVQNDRQSNNNNQKNS